MGRVGKYVELNCKHFWSINSCNFNLCSKKTRRGIHKKYLKSLKERANLSVKLVKYREQRKSGFEHMKSFSPRIKFI